jgi:glycine/D-amino acid oxidase-like deaminating enzyme
VIGTPHGLPRSFWLTRRGPAEEADAVVVGGGIAGLSTAWWLARLAPQGYRVLLLEASALAARASGRNAGFLLTGTPDPFTELAATMGRERALALWHLSRENRELLRRELLDPGTVDADFLPEGSWIVALADDAGFGGGGGGRRQEEALAASCEALRAEGFDCKWRDAAAVRRASGSERLGGGLFQPRDGGLDPVRLCRGLAASGAFAVRTGSPVQALEPAGERVRVVADGGDVVAPRVVVCLNAYAPVLLPHLAPRVRPVRAQMLATAPGERRLAGVWYVNDGHEYLRQLADGTVVLGGARQTAVAEEVGVLEAPTAKVQGALERFLAAAFPHLAGRPVVRRWAGIMGFTADGLPALGAVPEVPGAVYAAGFNGHGMSLGFVTGRHLARHVLGEAELEALFPAASEPAHSPG